LFALEPYSSGLNTALNVTRIAVITPRTGLRRMLTCLLNQLIVSSFYH